jgi:hypothetical protein
LTRLLVEISRLVRAEYRIEIEATAVMRERKAVTPHAKVRPWRARARRK